MTKARGFCEVHEIFCVKGTAPFWAAEPLVLDAATAAVGAWSRTLAQRWC